MGEIIELDTEILIPTQPMLRENQFQILLCHYLRNSGKYLIPVKPSEEEGKYLSLNGHHTSCLTDVVKDRLGLNLYGWVPKDNKDFIPKSLTNEYSNDWFDQDNWTIEGRFWDSERILTEGCPKSISEMRKNYSWLKDMDFMFGYFFPYFGK